MRSTTRRRFIQTAGAGAAVLGASARIPAAGAGSKEDLVLALASYTFREFPTEQALAMTRRLGLKRICFKDFHLKLDSSPEQIAATIAKVKEAGLDLYAGGVIYMRTEAEVHQAFSYAKAAGMRMIIGVPNHDLLPLVNKKVQEFDIPVAIHNHGPGDKVYPTPESIYERIKGLDRRIGLCIDVGHTQRLGIDPSIPAEKYAARLYDVHIKDVSGSTAAGNTIEIGRGVIDMPRFLRTLIRIGYKGALALEFEKDTKDPLPGAAESIGYLRGALAMI